MTKEILANTILGHLDSLERANRGISGITTVLEEVAVHREIHDKDLFPDLKDSYITDSLQSAIQALSDLQLDKLNTLRRITEKEARR